MTRYLGPYLVLHPLLVPNGPGKKPSAMRFSPGTLMDFDGDEPVDIDALERCGAIRRHNEGDPAHEAKRSELEKAEPGRVKAAKKKRRERGER